MDLRDLSYFETIASTSTYDEASEILGLTKQALTKSVRRLEDDLGGQLFVRDGRGKLLTPLGATLLERARRLRVTVGDIEREMRDHARGLAGTVRIGAGATPVEYVLPKVFRQLQERAPDIRVQLSMGMSDALKDRLRQSELDMILSPCHLEDLREFDAHVVLRDEVIVATSKRHPLAGKKVGLEDMAGQGWVLQSRSISMRSWLDAAFTRRGFAAPVPRIEADSMVKLNETVEEMQLLTFCGRHVLNDLVELPNPDTTMRRDFAVMSRKGAYLPPAAELLREIIVENSEAETEAPAA